MNPDLAMIEAARGGDREAQAGLVSQFQRPVFSVCYRMLGNFADAEDAAQETFLKSFRSLAAYDPSRSFSTWLLSIAAHHCIDRIRRRREQVVSLDALPPWRWIAADVPDPEDEAIHADDAERMAALLQTLPADYRLVIVLRYWHDLSYEEIAEILADTESAVKSRLHRARRQLAAALVGPPAAPRPGASNGHDPTGAAMPVGKGGVHACRALMLAS